VGTRTPDLYRVNPEFIVFPTTYMCSRGLLTSLSACKFVGHRAGRRVGNRPIFHWFSTGRAAATFPVRFPGAIGSPPIRSPRRVCGQGSRLAFFATGGLSYVGGYRWTEASLSPGSGTSVVQLGVKPHLQKGCRLTIASGSLPSRLCCNQAEIPRPSILFKLSKIGATRGSISGPHFEFTQGKASVDLFGDCQ
jgi:hypothetical protein